MVPRLYYVRGSPPVRAVLLAVKNVGIEVDLKLVEVMKDEQFDPKYLKMNPQHSVPTLDDNGFILWDSHAINGYLVNKYGKSDDLYPRGAKARARVDQRLHFDSGTLFPRLRATAFPILRQGHKEISEKHRTDTLDAFQLTNTILGDQPWIAGDQMTIADFSCISSITTLNLFVPKITDFSRLSAWVERCKTEMPHYHWGNQKGLEQFEAMVKMCMDQ